MSARPPRLLEFLLERALPPGEVRDGTVGDLGEAFAARAGDGRGRAVAWYAWTALRMGVRYGSWRIWRRVMGGPPPGAPAGASVRSAPSIWSPGLTVASDLRIAARSYARDASFTLVSVVTLALGIGATTAAFSLLDGVLLKPLPFAQPEELVEIRELGEGRRFAPSFPNFADWRERSAAFEGMIAMQPFGSQPVLDAGDPVRLPVLAVSRDFLETLGVPPHVGRDLNEEEHEPVGPLAAALVSHAFWTERLGADRDLDRLSFSAFGQRYRVVGVLPPGFRLFYDADVYISAERWPGTVRSAHAYRVVGRLADGLGLETADRDLDRVTADLKERYGDETQAESAQLRRLKEVVLGDQRRPLGLLMAAAGLVLLVACANVASTHLARGTTRRSEMAVRSALGAGRTRLVRQLLTESLLLTSVAGALGVAAAWLAVELVSAAPGVMPRMETVQLDVRVLAVASLATLGTALLFGTVPALGLTREGAMSGMRGGRGSSARRGRTWDALVAGETALAVVLLVGAALLVRSLDGILSLDTGWTAEGVIVMSIQPPNGTFESSDEAVAFLRALEEEVSGVVGVGAAGVATFGPLDAGNWTAPARDPDLERNVDGFVGWRLISPGYFDALQIPIARGRSFRPGDTGVAIVNEALARALWGDQDPVGRRIVSNFDPQESPREVVGVTPVARDWRFAESEQMEMFVPWWDVPEQAVNVNLMVRSGTEPAMMIPRLREVVRVLLPRTPVEFSTLEGGLRDSVADRRFVALVMTSLAAIGLVMALVGVFGVVSYSVAQQKREIGIRRALGASAASVRARVRRSALRPVIAGLVLGAAGALGASRFLEALLYDVAPRDPATLLGVTLLFLGAAFVATETPARRTSAVDPARVLREE